MNAQAAPVEQEIDYEAELNSALDKVDAKKRGEEVDAPADPAPVEQETPVAEKEPAEEPKDKAQPEPVDIDLNTLPQSVRDAVQARLDAAAAAVRQKDNDNRSLAGRISAYQRRYEEAVGKRAPEPAPQVTAAQTDEWTNFAADYPDIAKAIESRYAATQPPTATDPKLEEIVQYVETQKREQFLNDAYEAVDTVHPGWREVGRTKEFQEWKSSNVLHERLASSDDIADAIALFDLYELHGIRNAPPGTDPLKAAEATKLAARREVQADGAKSPSNRSAAPNTNVDTNDPDQLFAFYASKSNARLKSRYHN
jgi:hypothetical protein